MDSKDQDKISQCGGRDILDELFDVIAARASADPEKSYVAALMAGGVKKIGRKILEEAAELDEAAREPDNHVGQLHETCDLLFHTFVMASYSGLTLDDIRSEFVRRFGVSGLAEKAARRPKDD